MKIYLLAKFDGYGGSLNDAERSRNYDLRLQARVVGFGLVSFRWRRADFVAGGSGSLWCALQVLRMSNVFVLDAASVSLYFELVPQR